MYAYIKHSGKQFKVEEGAVITVDLTDAEPGSNIEITDIPLLVKDDGSVEINPKGKIECEVQEHFKDKKITVLKFRAKKCYRRKKGHRQQYTKLIIKKINV